jgi:VWFA-related protein
MLGRDGSDWSLLLCAMLACTCSGQGSSPADADSGVVTLDVLAYDRQGAPIGDLSPDDLRLFDSGHLEEIVSMRRNKTHQHQPVVILFDLLNSHMPGRALVKNEIVDSFRHTESSENLYVYLLTKHATLYPIHGIEDYEGPPTPENVPWIQLIGPLLDQALRRLQEFRPADMEDPDFRLQETVQSLSNLAAHISSVPGRKSIVWISHGVPIDTTWYSDSYTAAISQLCSHLVANSISVYVVHESVDAAIHMDSLRFLDEFAGLTGGVTFPSNDTEAAIFQALKDGRLSYSISYHPAPHGWDGKFHKVHIKTRRRGLRLRTIQGYYAVQVAISRDPSPDSPGESH